MVKAIFHVDDPVNWPLTIRNANNALQFFIDNKMEYQMEILANSLAVQELVLLSSQYANELELLVSKSVVINACANSLHSLSIDKDSLFGFTQIVPSGVVHLILQQSKGYSYIKP